MDGFYTWLIILSLLALYSVLLIIIYRHFFVENKDPDAVLHFMESPKTLKGNFVLLLPIEEVRKKEQIIVEIQNSFVEEDDSQELQSI